MRHVPHKHFLVWETDGDYIVFASQCLCTTDWESLWIEHTRWLIPGTQRED